MNPMGSFNTPFLVCTSYQNSEQPHHAWKCSLVLLHFRLASPSACASKTFFFCLLKRFLPFPIAESRNHKCTDGVNAADMGEFVSDACNKQNDRELQTGAGASGI